MTNWFYLRLRAIGHALRRLVRSRRHPAVGLVVGIALSLPGGGAARQCRLAGAWRLGAPRSACSWR